MGLLCHEQLLQLQEAIVSAGLASDRAALLVGIDLTFVASLPESSPVSSSSGGILMVQLDAINSARSLEDGTVPLAILLKNALRLAELRSEVVVFRRMLQAVTVETSTTGSGSIVVRDGDGPSLSARGQGSLPIHSSSPPPSAARADVAILPPIDTERRTISPRDRLPDRNSGSRGDDLALLKGIFSRMTTLCEAIAGYAKGRYAVIASRLALPVFLTVLVMCVDGQELDSPPSIRHDDIAEFGERVKGAIASQANRPFPERLDDNLRRFRNDLDERLRRGEDGSSPRDRSNLRANLAWAFAHDMPDEPKLARAYELASDACWGMQPSNVSNQNSPVLTGCLEFVDVLAVGALVGDANTSNEELTERAIRTLEGFAYGSNRPADPKKFPRSRVRIQTDLAMLNLELARRLRRGNDKKCEQASARIRLARDEVKVSTDEEDKLPWSDPFDRLAVADLNIQAVAVERVCLESEAWLYATQICRNPKGPLKLHLHYECALACVIQRAGHAQDSKVQDNCRSHAEAVVNTLAGLPAHHPLQAYDPLVRVAMANSPGQMSTTMKAVPRYVVRREQRLFDVLERIIGDEDDAFGEHAQRSSTP